MDELLRRHTANTAIVTGVSASRVLPRILSIEGRRSQHFTAKLGNATPAFRVKPYLSIQTPLEKKSIFCRRHPLGLPSPLRTITSQFSRSFTVGGRKRDSLTAPRSQSAQEEYTPSFIFPETSGSTSSRSSIPLEAMEEEASRSAHVRSLRKEAADMAETSETNTLVVFSPYRVCPIGAHIDHQGGPVTAMALNFGVTFAFVPVSSPVVKLRSRQYGGEVLIRLDQGVRRRKEGAVFDVESLEEESFWGDYARGAAWALNEAGYSLTNGVCGVIGGEEGVDCSGISSSAAVGVAYLLALAQANSIHLSHDELIQLDRRLENGFLGLKNGILDQSAIVLSRKGELTVIDCRGGTHGTIPFARKPTRTAGYQQNRPALDQLPANRNSSLGKMQQRCRCGVCSSSFPSQPKGLLVSGKLERAVDATGRGIFNQGLPFSILLAFSGVRGALTSTSGYNNRVRECREAAYMLMKGTCERPIRDTPLEALPVLSDLAREQFEANEHLLPDDLQRRARHFFSECNRVERGTSFWREGDLPSFGDCVSESGLSSIENYECGVEPLIKLREIMLHTPGVLGARFSGAGFRGCCLALVWRCMAQEAAERISAEYSATQPGFAKNVCGKLVIVCESGDGARLLK